MGELNRIQAVLYFVVMLSDFGLSNIYVLENKMILCLFYFFLAIGWAIMCSHYVRMADDEDDKK